MSETFRRSVPVSTEVPSKTTGIGVRQRLVAVVALAVFAVIAVGTAPFVAAAFPLADLSHIDGDEVTPEGLWSAVQLYAVLCVSVLIPAFLWTGWLRRFGGPLEAVGLGISGASARRPLSILGVWVRGQMAGLLLIGFLCLLLATAGWYQVGRSSFEPGVLVTVFLGLLLAALYEELLFRGFGYWALARVGGHGTAIILSSGLFAVAHANNAGAHWVGLINTVLAGVLLAVLRWRSGSLWSAWGVHLGWNATLGLVFGARMSGFSIAGRLLDAQVSASGSRHLMLAGGSYGPEGSVLLTPMLLVWIAWLVRPSASRGWLHQRHDQRSSARGLNPPSGG